MTDPVHLPVRIRLLPLDATGRVLTLLVALAASSLVIGLGVGATLTSGIAGDVLLVAAVASAAAPVGVALRAPVAVQVEPGALVVCRRLGRSRRLLAADADVAVFTPAELGRARGLSGGFCGRFGRCRIADGNVVELAVTDSGRMLRVGGVAHRPVVVSPGDPARFAAALVAAVPVLPATQNPPSN